MVIISGKNNLGKLIFIRASWFSGYLSGGTSWSKFLSYTLWLAVTNVRNCSNGSSHHFYHFHLLPGKSFPPRQYDIQHNQHIAVITAKLLALIALVVCEKSCLFWGLVAYIHKWHALVPCKACDWITCTFAPHKNGQVCWTVTWFRVLWPCNYINGGKIITSTCIKCILAHTEFATRIYGVVRKLELVQSEITLPNRFSSVLSTFAHTGSNIIT